MKAFFTELLLKGSLVLLILGVLVGCGWLCYAYPAEITNAIETVGNIAFYLFVGLGVLGAVSIFVLSLFAPPPAQPNRRPDTLTPLIVGLVLGWWLGGPGPGGSSDC